MLSNFIWLWTFTLHNPSSGHRTFFLLSSLKPASSIDNPQNRLLMFSYPFVLAGRKSILLAYIISFFLSFLLAISESAGCALCLATYLLSHPSAFLSPRSCISPLSSILNFSKPSTRLPKGFIQIQPCLPSAQYWNAFSLPIRQCPCSYSTVSTVQGLASACYVSLFFKQPLCIWYLEFQQPS